MSTKQERLAQLRELLSSQSDADREQRRDALVRMWLSGQHELLADVYRDATGMVQGQRIRADVWFVAEKILRYLEAADDASSEP